MATTLPARRREAEDNDLASALPLPLVGAVPAGQPRGKAVAGGMPWLLPLVADAIDSCMSRKEAAIRMGLSESVLSRQLSNQDGKCLNFERFGQLGDAVAIALADRIRREFGLDDPATRIKHAAALVTQGLSLLVAEAQR